MPCFSFILNGQQRKVEAQGNTILLYVLRSELNSPKYGCGAGSCGACNVLIDGEISNSCARTLAETDDAVIVTLEGLAEDSLLHRLQRNFLDLNAGQCGYCLSGILISAYKLLTISRHPSRSEIQLALKDNLCRCGAHNRIIKAIEATVSTSDE